MTEKRFSPFRLIDSPLKGINLIESSAGTGKTYTITGLYLRLLLENDLTVDKILVVTFTEAATSELNDRIRARLKDMLDLLNGSGGGDPFLLELYSRIKDREGAKDTIRKAIAGFDEASIFTIHSFCRRMLNESAFESGSLFDTELVTDQSDLRQEIIEDYWRQKFYEQEELFLQYMLSEISIGKLISFIGNNDSRTGLKIIPELKEPETSAIENDFISCLNKTAPEWKSAKEKIISLLYRSPSLYEVYSKDSFTAAIRNMDELFGQPFISPYLPKDFHLFTSEGVRKKTRTKCASPAHPFFELAQELAGINEELLMLYRQKLLAIKAQLFSYLQKELKNRKVKLNIQSFDDLLLNLHSALSGEGGKTLAHRIRERYSAALIDEFQDTDPVQYEIFRGIFSSEESILFLIGDPKQAIYGFRGADIFAYLKASENSESRYTLGENWRSQPGLIKAVNTIFNGCRTPFLYSSIGFEDALAADKKEGLSSLVIQDEDNSPFHMWVIPSENDEKSSSGKKGANRQVTKASGSEISVNAVTAHISRLILKGRNGIAMIGENPVKEKDIAVLVKTNDQAALVKDKLSLLSVPAVIYSSGNVFNSEEACELLRIISCLADTENESRICSALATEIWGMSGNEIEKILKDDLSWEYLVLRLRNYNRRWLSHGFIAMFREFLKNEGVMKRLMSLNDGERRLTNLLHLSELLHQSSKEDNSSPQALVNWLSGKMSQEAEKLEEHQLRLESDEDAVKIITIHKSKGLEFPIVYCPFLWDASTKTDSSRPILFHDEKNGMQQVLDIGSDEIEISRSFFEKEQLAENLRLLYVALTRARNRCYITWGKINGAGKTAPALLFHNREPENMEAVASETEKKFSGMNDSEILNDLNAIAGISDGTLLISPIPDLTGLPLPPYAEEAGSFACREFQGNIKSVRQLTSFSALVSSSPGKHRELIRSDQIDQGDISPEENQLLSDLTLKDDIFSFPRGANAGICLHRIFEQIDFTASGKAAKEEIINSCLDSFGYESKWMEAVSNMVSNVLSTPLLPGHEGLILSNISREERLNELQFYFPLKKISPEVLSGLFNSQMGHNIPYNYSDRTDRLRFSPQEGFMRGFIDMIFRFEGRYYLVDWKSNHLGNESRFYTKECLEPVMQENMYILQYHIYTVALNRYLSLRKKDYNYDKDFGGVFYIFLRGAGPSKSATAAPSGIYYDKPDKRLISMMEEAFIDISGKAK